jgi:hypothetical protein
MYTFSGGVNLEAVMPTAPYPHPRSSTLSPNLTSARESIANVPRSTRLGEKHVPLVLKIKSQPFIFTVIIFSA